MLKVKDRHWKVRSLLAFLAKLKAHSSVKMGSLGLGHWGENAEEIKLLSASYQGSARTSIPPE